MRLFIEMSFIPRNWLREEVSLKKIGNDSIVRNLCRGFTDPLHYS